MQKWLIIPIFWRGKIFRSNFEDLFYFVNKGLKIYSTRRITLILLWIFTAPHRFMKECLHWSKWYFNPIDIPIQCLERSTFPVKQFQKIVFNIPRYNYTLYNYSYKPENLVGCYITLIITLLTINGWCFIKDVPYLSGTRKLKAIKFV